MKYSLLNVLQEDNAKKPMTSVTTMEKAPLTQREKEQNDHFNIVVKKANESLSRNKTSRNTLAPGNLKISKSFKELVSRS
jgi:hypothetical protein